jgi:hypothetical protein
MTDRSLDPEATRPKVVYIAGARNCGSTLLDAILGNAPGAQSLGEVGGFHRYGPAEACACRLPAASCRLCGAAAAALHAAGPDFPLVLLQPLKERRFHWMLIPTRARHRYAELADVIFRSVLSTTGCSVLIDSSKNATRAAALAHDSELEVRVIHLVRDGRGYLRSRRSRAAVDGTRYLGPVEMAGWLAKNLLIGTVLRRTLPRGAYLRCRYEDLLTDLDAELRRIGSFTGVDVSGLAEAATTPPGVPRSHLYEPVRRTDYRRVVLDPKRLASQRETPGRNLRFWVLGGFLSRLWGYDRPQSYLAKT